MLAVSKAYLQQPKLVMADELSLGLAPLIVDEIYESLLSLNAAGAGLLVVEQYVGRLLGMADHVYLMSRGSIAWSGTPADLDDGQVIESYLGAGGG
jgi:branched-chain amino acid transport system ATP-binding protein